MSARARLLNKVYILPFVVLCLSLLSLCNRPEGIDNPAFCISIAGLLSVALFVLNVNFCRVVFYVWAGLQLVVIRYAYENGQNINTADIADFTQGIKLPMFMAVKSGQGSYQLGLNVVAVFLLGIAVATRPGQLIGSWLSFSNYRGTDSLVNGFPVTGMAERYISLSGENDWLVVKLQESFAINNKPVCYALIRRNDKLPVVNNRTAQLVIFKPVYNVNMIAGSEAAKGDFEDEVWALCR